MIILNLEAENIKRIKAIKITPEKNMNVVGGKNGAGKSTVLDIIQYAMDGKSSIPGKPIKEGETEGKIVLDCGDMVVTRTFKEDGKTSLKVTSKDGAVYKKPQDMLYDKAGALAYDPLEFSRMSPREQADILRGFSDFDFEAHDKAMNEAYEIRKKWNKEAKDYETKLHGKVEHTGLPDELLDPAELYQNIEEAKEHNSYLDTLEGNILSYENDLERLSNDRDSDLEAIKNLENRLEVNEAETAKYYDLKSNAGKSVQEFKTIDTAPIIDQHHNALEINQKIHENGLLLEQKKLHEEALETAGNYDKIYRELQKKRLDAVASVKLPIDGLTFDADGISMNGIPFDQCSGSERLRISVAIGLANMGEFAVLLIKDGSLLDDDGLALISKMVEESGGQCWLEKVTGNQESCNLFIEDGAVVSEVGV